MKKIIIMFVCAMAVLASRAEGVCNSDTIKTKKDIVTNETATKFSDDQKLIEIFNQMKGKPAKVQKVKGAAYYQAKAKKQKKAALIWGGAMVCAGLVCNIIGDHESESVKYKEHLDSDGYVDRFDFDIAKSRYFGTMSIIGTSLMGAGVIVGASLWAHGNKMAKRANTSAALWENSINLGNGNSLAFGVDAIRDNIKHQQTLGLGVRFNF